ncbi:MaoC/PaaZ C-terminal domain-containing protein [Bacillus massiliigorillae]|uniref:MaoC/PaaZ C-terminal domain-containing protein n=1 Tax=Bacillus massiliigorillae TaxID=1243664 RepID=UPI0003A4166B|nr:MaoC/PaaZ C-terminal domain-containing protein [Bacillus massiliigorillae]
MLLGKKRKLGRKIEEIPLGEKLTLTETIEDKDLLLYLGLTGDANPLYVQHDFASLTEFEKPIVPNIMLTGIITSAINKYIPGPGSYIKHVDISYIKPVFHYETVQFIFEVIDINVTEGYIIISVQSYNAEDELILDGKVKVCPPKTVDNTEN